MLDERGRRVLPWAPRCRAATPTPGAPRRRCCSPSPRRSCGSSEPRRARSPRWPQLLPAMRAGGVRAVAAQRRARRPGRRVARRGPAAARRDGRRAGRSRLRVAGRMVAAVRPRRRRSPVDGGRVLIGGSPLSIFRLSDTGRRRPRAPDRRRDLAPHGAEGEADRTAARRRRHPPASRAGRSRVPTSRRHPRPRRRRRRRWSAPSVPSGGCRRRRRPQSAAAPLRGPDTAVIRRTVNGGAGCGPQHRLLPP